MYVLTDVFQLHVTYKFTELICVFLIFKNIALYWSAINNTGDGDVRRFMKITNHSLFNFTYHTYILVKGNTVSISSTSSDRQMIGWNEGQPNNK